MVSRKEDVAEVSNVSPFWLTGSLILLTTLARVIKILNHHWSPGRD